MKRKAIILLILMISFSCYTISQKEKIILKKFSTLKTFSRKFPIEKSIFTSMDKNIKYGHYNELYLKGDPVFETDGKYGKISFKTYITDLFPVIYLGCENPEFKLSFPHYYYKLYLKRIDKNSFSVKFKIKKVLKKFFGKQIPLNKPLNFTYKLIFFLPHTKRHNLISYLYRFSIILVKDGKLKIFKRIPSFDTLPIVDFPDNKKVTITFRTSTPAMALLIYKGEGDKNFKFSKYISYGKEHIFYIKTDKTDKKYLYKVALKFKNSRLLNISKLYSFKTKCRENESFSFGIFGDTRASYENSDSNLYGVNFSVLKDVIRGFYLKKVDFLIGLGDYATLITNSPENFVEEINSYRKVISFISSYIPVFEVRGDHEIFGDVSINKKFKVIPYKLPLRPEKILPYFFITPENGPKKYRKNFPQSDGMVYSFIWGNSLFISLDTAYGIAHGIYEPSKYNINGTICDEELKWLEMELKRGRERKVKHIFVFDHAPPFPNGGHIRDAMYYSGKNPVVTKVREKFLDLLSKYDVDILFSGHEHNYSRTLIDSSIERCVKNPFYQIISGGGGAPTYPINLNTPWHKNVEAYSTERHFIVVKISGNEVNITVYNRNLEIIDSFKYIKK